MRIFHLLGVAVTYPCGFRRGSHSVGRVFYIYYSSEVLVSKRKTRKVYAFMRHFFLFFHSLKDQKNPKAAIKKRTKEKQNQELL